MNENQLSPEWESICAGIRHVIEQQRGAEFGDKNAHLQAAARAEGFLAGLRSMALTWEAIAKDFPATEEPTVEPVPEPTDRTPQSAYYKPLAMALNALGGSAVPRDAIAKVGEIIADRLKTGDWGLVETGRVRWMVNTCWARKKLRDHGILKHTRDGIWELSESGKIWAETPSEKLPAPIPIEHPDQALLF